MIMYQTNSQLSGGQSQYDFFANADWGDKRHITLLRCILRSLDIN